MFTWILKRRLDAFERSFDFDMNFAREIVDISPKALVMYFRATDIGNYNKSIPLDAWFAARLVAIASEDCGPCTQLGSPTSFGGGAHGTAAEEGGDTLRRARTQEEQLHTLPTRAPRPGPPATRHPTSGKPRASPLLYSGTVRRDLPR